MTLAIIRQLQSGKELDMKLVAGLRSRLHVTQHALSLSLLCQFGGFFGPAFFQQFLLVVLMVLIMK